MKTVIFYTLLFVAIISAVSIPSFMAIALFVLSVILLGLLTIGMTEKELYAVTGANFYNSLINTKDFTEE